MGIIDKLFGGNESPNQQANTSRNQNANISSGARNDDEAAIERYRYMLKTAPPETIEQAHAEAFSKLTPEQRQTVLQQLNQNIPENERRDLQQNGDDPQTLARAATRAEMRQPGMMERMFGGAGGGGIGFGGMLAGSLMGSIAGTVIGSYVAQEFFDNDGGSGSGDNNGGDQANDESAANDDQASADTADSGDVGDAGGDFGGFGDF